MTILRIVLSVSALLLAAATHAAGPAATAPKPAPVPVDGMLCLTETTVESPQVGTDLEMVSGGGGIPSCPVNFSNCQDVPGRSCRLRNCVTEDLGYSSCKKPGGRVLHCTNGNLQQTTCDCEERLSLICCSDGTCGFDCGICQGGSLTTVCP